MGGVAGRADGGKNILHTIDPAMLMAWGNVLQFGATKYHQRNFMVAPGMQWSRVYDSLLRHLLAFWAGEWLDPESGEPHLAHVLCNLQFLWTYHQHEQYHPGDDRPSSIEYKGDSYSEWEAVFNGLRTGERKVITGDEVPDPSYDRSPVRDVDPAKAIDRAIREREALPPPAVHQGHPMPYAATVNRVDGILSADRFADGDVTLCNADIRNLLNLAKRSLKK